MTGAKLPLTILLGAVPDPTYSPTSHRGSVVIAPREFLVGSLARAVETFEVFVLDNQLSPVNLLGAGLIRLDGVPLCRVDAAGKLLAVDSSGLATGLQYRDPTAPRPKFKSIGEAVRFLREDSGLIRRQIAEAVGISPETLRNLELSRHATGAWSLAKILSHPALADLPRLAAESGLKLPKGAAAEVRNPQFPGTLGTTAPAGGRGDGGEGGGDGEGEGGGSGGSGSGSAPDRGPK